MLITCSKGQDASDFVRLMMETVIEKQLEFLSKFEELKLEVLSMKDSLAFVHGTVASVNATLHSVNGTVASVQENVDFIRDNVASVEEIIANVKGNVDYLIEKDGELRLEISDIKETVASVNQDTKSVKETVAYMEETMASVKENTDIVKETVASVNESTNTLLTTINELRVGSQEEDVDFVQGTEYLVGGTEASVEVTVVLNSTATLMAPEESECEPPFVKVGETCLYFATVGEMNHQEARQHCQSAKGDLTTVSSPSQFKALIDYIYDTDLKGRRFWIDGTDEDTEGIWVSFTGSLLPMETPFWAGYAKHQEPNGKRSENCINLNPGGGYYLNDCPCNVEQNAVCEIPKTSPRVSSSPNQLSEAIECPTFYINVGGKCLAFLTWLDETWEQAKQSCTGYHGQLATMADVELFREVYLYLHQKGVGEHSFWLGGSDGDTEGSWTWLDGTSVSMGTPFWGMGGRGQEPDGGSGENCLAMPAKGYHYFRDVSCASTFSPLCEYVD